MLDNIETIGARELERDGFRAQILVDPEPAQHGFDAGSEEETDFMSAVEQYGVVGIVIERENACTCPDCNGWHEEDSLWSVIGDREHWLTLARDMIDGGQNVRVIQGYKRAPSSVNGNPAYVFTFTDGTQARSMSDAGWAYAVGNPELREGSRVRVELTKSGRIRSMRPA